MQTRTHNQSFSQRASARRRIRRTTAGHLYCSTNGCTTYLQPDRAQGVARCPVCGARRRLH